MATPPPPANFFDVKPRWNYRGTIFGVCIPLLSICWLVTAIRLWVRFRVTKTPGWDDLFVTLTLIHITIGIVAFCVSTVYGMGQHIYLLTPGDIRSYLICHWLIGLSYVASTALIKISLLFQYLRVFKQGTFTYRFSQFMLVFIALWGFAFTFMGWLPCLPKPSAFWDQTGKGCYASFSTTPAIVIKTIEGHSGVNVAFDLIVVTIPFRLLFIDDAPVNKKGLMALLAMGLLTCGFSIWRLENIVSTQAGFFPVADPTWTVPEPFLVSFCEVCVASICACTPFFWPIITAQLNKIFVMYEFKVSSESRYRDDEVELASTNSWPAATKTTTKEEVRSLDSRSSGNELGKKQNTTHYKDDYVQNQVNPFAEEFQTDTVVESGGTTGKKKGGFVRFHNPV